jgi:hypothetical protein
LLVALECQWNIKAMKANTCCSVCCTFIWNDCLFSLKQEKPDRACWIATGIGDTFWLGNGLGLSVSRLEVWKQPECDWVPSFEFLHPCLRPSSAKHIIIL